MIVIFIAAFFCVLNICLWCTFFLKFRKLFSTEDIISSTHEQVEEMINELNYNASRNIDLIEDRIKQLKAAVSDSDRHLELIKKELEAQKANFDYYKKIENAKSMSSQIPPSQIPPNDGIARYLRNQPPKNSNKMYSDISSGLQSEKAYELTSQGKEQIAEKNAETSNDDEKMQPGDLFEAAGQIVSKTGTTFTVENDGSSYTNVPILGGNVRYADEPIKADADIRQIIRNLHAAGYSVDEIASELNRSTIEVQLVLEINN